MAQLCGTILDDKLFSASKTMLFIVTKFVLAIGLCQARPVFCDLILYCMVKP